MKNTFNQEITQDKLDTIATYMDDEIRESLHGGDLTPEQFLVAYIMKDPSFLDLLYGEFGIL